MIRALVLASGLLSAVTAAAHGVSTTVTNGPAVIVTVTFDDGAGPLEDERPRRSPFSPVALVWVLLFVVGTIYRACTSG